MATYVFSKNGMGDYETGTGMREDMLMMPYTNYLYRAGIVESGDLAVSQRGAGANMSVDVAAGKCMVANTSYSANTANSTKYWGVLSEGITNLVINTNTSGSTRVDIVVVKIDTTAAPNDYATNVGSVIIVEGTPGGGTPATPSNSYKLATITIPTGTTTSITTAMIADNRARAYVDGSKILVPNNSYIQTTNSGGTDSNLIGLDSSNHLILGNNSDTSTQVYVSALVSATTYGLYFGTDVNEPFIGARTNHGLRIIANALAVAYFGTDYKLRLYNPDGGGSYANIYNDSNNNLFLMPSGNTDLVVIGRMPRDNTGSATYQNAHIQSGWGYFTGSGGTTGTIAVTLPITYSSTSYRVVLSLCGVKTTAGAPTSEANISGAVLHSEASYFVASSSQFSISVTTSGTFISGHFYLVSWIAIGPV
jgi:hypothetical protein